MSTVIRPVPFKNDDFNGSNLVPIPPTLGTHGTRETPGRPTKLLLAINALTLAPFYQGKNDLNSHSLGAHFSSCQLLLDLFPSRMTTSMVPTWFPYPLL